MRARASEQEITAMANNSTQERRETEFRVWWDDEGREMMFNGALPRDLHEARKVCHIAWMNGGYKEREAFRASERADNIQSDNLAYESEELNEGMH
jgi:hypothetical protein